MEQQVNIPVPCVERLTSRGDAEVKGPSGGGIPMQGGRRFRGRKDPDSRAPMPKGTSVPAKGP